MLETVASSQNLLV